MLKFFLNLLPSFSVRTDEDTVLCEKCGGLACSGVGIIKMIINRQRRATPLVGWYENYDLTFWLIFERVGDCKSFFRFQYCLR